MNTEQARDTLTANGFTVEDKRPERGYFVVACTACGARWSLGIKPVSRVHDGNVLSLLDHAASHKEARP